MWHPYQGLSPPLRKRLLIGFALLSLLCMLALQRINESIRIVDFELAGSLARANEIMHSWPEGGAVDAAMGIGLDYLFLLAYPIALGLATVQVAHSMRFGRWRNLGYLLASLLLAAGLLDAVENFALYQIVMGQGTEYLAKIARFCAIPKFLIVILSVLYLAAGLLNIFTKRIQ